MATRKPQKTELIAIYRLEFYKNQKHWKLSTDARKEKDCRSSCPTVPVKNIKTLNETYSIETNIDSDANELNNAFLKDDSEKDTPVFPTIQKSLQTQLLDPINACHECQHTVMKPQNPWADYVDDGFIGGSDTVEKCSGDGNEFEGFDGWVEGMVWTNSAFAEPGWTGDVPAQMDIKQEAEHPNNMQVAEYPNNMLVTACPNIVQGIECPDQLGWATDYMLHQLDQATPWPDDQLWVPDIWGEEELLLQSLESVDEFMVGAHSAPHSSEMELCVTYEGDGELNVSEGTLSRMSGAALSSAVRYHTSSLKRLLREAGLRRKHRSTLSLDLCAPDHLGLAPRDFFSTDYSYEAFPTRDIPTSPLHPTILCNEDFAPPPPICKQVVPLQPANQARDTFANPIMFRDRFLAGSHRNKKKMGFVGRGRGRLPNDRDVEI